MTEEKKIGETEKESALLEKLRKRYENDGLKLSQHLEGLLYNDGVHYWDYIAVDTLLSLQRPITSFADEVIFITYHQICELYFKLCIHELSILTNTSEKYRDEDLSEASNWVKRLKRIKFYFSQLDSSLSLMHKQGNDELLDRAEFTKFRLALLPASGFQTAQLRMIEIMLTNLENLQHKDFKIDSTDLNELYENIYWKRGAIQTSADSKPILNEKGENKKAKTLIDFEIRYDTEFKALAKKFKDNNLYCLFNRQPQEVKKNENILNLLREIDKKINCDWKGHHHTTVKHHLSNENDSIGNDKQGGGGTNWKEYLPPSKQGVIYFPEIYSQA